MGPAWRDYGLADWGQALCPALDVLLSWAKTKPAKQTTCPEAIERA